MKNTLIKLMCLMIALVCMFIFASCDKEENIDFGDDEEETTTKEEEETSTKDGESDETTTETETTTKEPEETTTSSEPTYDCDNGKHKWSKWDWTDPTCTTPETGKRECDLCGERESKTEGEAPGHQYPETWTPGVLSSERACEVCGNVESKAWTDVTTSAIAEKTNGEAWGSAGVTIDGKWYGYSGDAGFTGRGGVLEVTYTFSKVTIIDQIVVSGNGGGMPYKVYVVDVNSEEEETLIGGGAFVAGAPEGANVEEYGKSSAIVFAVNHLAVEKVIVRTDASGNGSSMWGEVRMAQNPELANQPATGAVAE
ncbi:MAG: hypothetical protein IJZ93_07035 [Clostridia bacterium]|nr:hypothetical protein [Clostridia bacterium]